jgi:dCTP deaminase
MILGDAEIRARCQTGLVEPFNPSNLQPASYDVSLAGPFLRPTPGQEILPGFADPSYIADEQTHLILRPGDFALASTLERVNLPKSVAAQIDGRSTMGRLGLAVHITAGWLDPGFSGRITLEICNHGPQVLCLPLGTTIAQLVFYEVAGCQEGYCGRYQDQEQTTGAQL